MLRKLIEVVTGIVIALNDNRSVRRKAYVPADKPDLGNYLWDINPIPLLFTG